VLAELVSSFRRPLAGRDFAPQPGHCRQHASLETSVNQVLADLETVTDEIRVKLHLASMAANAMWNEQLEPRSRGREASRSPAACLQAVRARNPPCGESRSVF
jgi:predicted outer membrane lipoprotein